MVGNLTNESLKITFASVLSECQDKLSKKWKVMDLFLIMPTSSTTVIIK